MPSQDRLSSSIDPTALTRNNQKIYILQTNRQFPSAHGRLAWNHPCFQANVLILFTELILNLFEHILILQEISRREGSLPPAQAIMGCCPEEVAGTCEIFILLTKLTVLGIEWPKTHLTHHLYFKPIFAYLLMGHLVSFRPNQESYLLLTCSWINWFHLGPSNHSYLLLVFFWGSGSHGWAVVRPTARGQSPQPVATVFWLVFRRDSSATA